MSSSSARKLLKTIPGFAVSAFFLWYTFWPRDGGKKGISIEEIRSLRIVAPLWILGVLLFSLLSYLFRTFRWHRMMRSAGTSTFTCFRVLMTSLAANNILPFRVGDIMRVFTYAPDLGAAPSFILSTVILEKLLDIFVLTLFFVATMATDVSHHLRLGANIALAISTVSLLVLIFGARSLIEPLQKLFTRLPQHSLIAKLEHWLILALECIRQIGLLGTLFLLIETFCIWSCEAVIFLSVQRVLGIQSDALGPWNAVAFVNLSFLIPSSPGGIGPFEAAAQKALVSHHASASQAALYGLALHAWMLVTITGLGGSLFLYHRYHEASRKPLAEEIDTLPATLP